MLSDEIMYRALLRKDSEFEGVFWVAVKTTGIFCRPTCTARKPKRKNVEFYKTTKEAILNGYVPCKICKPLEPKGQAPDYILELLKIIEADTTTRITEYGLKLMNIEPDKVRRWFKKNLGITFAGYQRMFRLNMAYQQIKKGDTVSGTAFGSGYNSLSGFTDAFRNLTGDSPKNAKYINIINLQRITTPLGPMLAGAVESGLCLLEFSDRRALGAELEDLKRYLKANLMFGSNPYLTMAEQQINEYFEGTRKIFDIPLVTPGTDFQNLVWQKLREIPYGTTKSYKYQAESINNPNAVRAVAKANGANRISIIIPCHRVIGENGNLTGYGGGIRRKKGLLDFEKDNTVSQNRMAF